MTKVRNAAFDLQVTAMDQTDFSFTVHVMDGTNCVLALVKLSI